MLGRRTYSIPLFAALVLSACGDVAGSNRGGVTIRLTDAPGDLAVAEVDISEIYLQGSSDEGGGRVYLFQGRTGMIDLLTLAGGRTVDLVEDAPVPPGTYSQLRFRIAEARIVTEDGREFRTQNGTLVCPSCGTPSGLKVNLPGGSVRIDDGGTIMVVDFDVSQSFGSERGASGRWVMHPVLHASDFQLSGEVYGTVALEDGVEIPACGGADRGIDAFVPTAATADIIRSGTTGADGTFVVAWLAPGDYTLGAAEVEYENGESLTFEAAADPAQVSIGSGARVEANILVSGVTCVEG
jgi:hypothetical protein